ncbi:MAG: YbaB/EbfC family nucleoid-associated protein [candidate division Zixibacteria bacterium CG_4_9_14_3_um_filter_46_8]|nr:MAG: YbaB/EbfC family nucleoid-associated protein [candidate division Zixibacteria bacterium CG_4_9_14_3_um_filter_46_8]
MAKGMGDMIKQVQKMQQKLAELQDELENLTVEGTSGGGMVRVVANGKGELTQIKIEPQAVDPNDIEMLEDLVLAAVNQAKEKSAELQQERMAKLTGGLNIPGMPGMPM